jgi:hypothetical protein
MLSGRRLDLLHPAPQDIEIEDIAHGLARVARWNGQTSGSHSFSVAQHSVLVERIAGSIVPDLTAAERLAALLHDSPEYVIGDLISPFKVVLGDGYKAIERRLLEAIHTRFNLPLSGPALSDVIKQADKVAAYWEATQFAGFSGKEADRILGRPSHDLPRDAMPPYPQPSEEAEQAFLSCFADLRAPQP